MYQQSVFQPFCMNNNSNVFQTLFNFCVESLRSMFQHGYIDSTMGNNIANEILNSQNSIMAELAKRTNNFTINTDNNSLLAFTGSVISAARESVIIKMNQQMAQRQNISNTMANNMMFGAMGGMNQNQMNAVQSYANSVVNIGTMNPPIQSSDNLQDARARNRYLNRPKQVVQNPAPTIDVPSTNIREIGNDNSNESSTYINNEGMFVLNSFKVNPVKYPKFDPDNKLTWPISLIREFTAIGLSNKNEQIKTVYSSRLKGKKLFEDNGINWDFFNCIDDGFKYYNINKVRSQLPEISIGVVTHDDYIVIDGSTGKEYDDIITVSDSNNKTQTKIITYSSDTASNIYSVHLEANGIVDNEIDLLHSVCNGQLRNMKLKSKSNNIIDLNWQLYSIALDYFVLAGLEIPRNVFIQYYDKFYDICSNYQKNYNTKFVSFVSDIQHELDLLPYRWSVCLNKFMVKYINEAFSRNILCLGEGVLSAPIISEWKNVLHLYEKSGYNPLDKVDKYRDVLTTIVFNTIWQIFCNEVMDPEKDDDDYKTIITSESIQPFVYRHNNKVLPDPKETNEKIVMETKINLAEFSVISIPKQFILTNIAPSRPNEDVVNFSPIDSHIGLFETVINESFSDECPVKNLIMLDSKSFEMIRNGSSIAMFNLYHTLDRNIGYALVSLDD